MSNCSTCSKPFGFFNRELGCIKCNRVYCKKCLCYKLGDPVNPKKIINVCLRCFKLANDSSLATANRSIKKVEELFEIKPEEEVIISTSTLLQPTTSDEIRNRLDALRNISDDNAETNDESENNNLDDIHKRLANLKGVEYKPTVNKILFATDVRSEQEKINDLLKQFVEEKEIDQQHEITSNSEHQPGSVNDIERRLAALRGQDVGKLRSQIDQASSREETEEEEIARTVLQYIEEANLPDFVADPDEQELINSIPLPPNGDKKSLEELPFCEICNEDAVLRCLECENLFCHSCFLEFHDEEDYKTHKTKPYEVPKKIDN